VNGTEGEVMGVNGESISPCRSWEQAKRIKDMVLRNWSTDDVKVKDIAVHFKNQDQIKELEAEYLGLKSLEEYWEEAETNARLLKDVMGARIIKNQDQRLKLKGMV